MEKPAKYLILVWYSSRINIFHLCKIKHYYTHYSRFDEEIPEERIDQLKRGTTIRLLIRQLTHEVNKTIQEKLELTSDPNRIKSLRNNNFTLVKKAIKGPTFFDTYYSSFEIDANPIIKEILSNIIEFLSSKRYSCIKDINIAVIKSGIIEPEGHDENWIDGLKAYFKAEALTPFESLTYILNWKTGRCDDEKFHKQLTDHARYAHLNPYYTATLCNLKEGYEECFRRPSHAESVCFKGQVNRTRKKCGPSTLILKTIYHRKKRTSSEINVSLCSFCGYKH